MTADRPVRILLVDDSADDRLLTSKALAAGEVASAVTTAVSGEHALALMRDRGAADWLAPDLVLLDLNLPGMSGHDVLREMKGDEALRDVPVVMLTTSSDGQDVRTAYREHVNAYVTKPGGFSELKASMRGLEGFWLRVAALPSR